MSISINEWAEIQNGVNVNGVAMTEVYANGTRVWKNTPLVEQGVKSISTGGVTLNIEGFNGEYLRVSETTASWLNTTSIGFVQVNESGGFLGEAGMLLDDAGLGTPPNGRYHWFGLFGMGNPLPGEEGTGLKIFSANAIDGGDVKLYSPELPFSKVTGFSNITVSAPSSDGYRIYQLQGSGFEFRFGVLGLWSDWITIDPT